MTDLKQVIKTQLQPIEKSNLGIHIMRRPVALSCEVLSYPRYMVEKKRYDSYYPYLFPIESDELSFVVTLGPNWRKVLVFRLKEGIAPYMGDNYGNMSYILDSRNYG